MKLTLVLRKGTDMVEIYGPGGIAAVVHIDTFHQDDLEVYRELVNEGGAEVELTLV